MILGKLRKYFNRLRLFYAWVFANKAEKTQEECFYGYRNSVPGSFAWAACDLGVAFVKLYIAIAKELVKGLQEETSHE